MTPVSAGNAISGSRKKIKNKEALRVLSSAKIFFFYQIGRRETI
jgi:hypothetical protein